MTILLLTDQNPSLGSGHLQRMLFLLKYLNQTGRKTLLHLPEAAFDNAKLTDIIPNGLLEFITNRMPRETTLIVRDKRDSTEAEIKSLQKTARIAVIDDRGDGRAFADTVVDLLPHPQHAFERAAYHPEAFIYGHEFANSVMDLDKSILEKNISFVVYGGYRPGKEQTIRLLSMLPKELKGILLTGSEYLSIENGRPAAKTNIHYAELILSARVLISHFGMTMYEAALGGASLVALNPSEYHNRLCENAPELNIIHKELLERADQESIRRIIKEAADKHQKTAEISSIKSRLQTNMENFTKLLQIA